MLQKNCKQKRRTANANTVDKLREMSRTGEGEKKLHMLANTYGMRLGQRGGNSPTSNLLYAGYPNRYDDN